MLRVDLQDLANTLKLKFEGRFTGDAAQNSCALMNRHLDGKTLLVDLTDVTFIDSTGEDVLSFFGRLGAEFVAETSYALDVCARLHLPLAHDGSPDPNPSRASRRTARRHKPTQNS